uniref:Vomeronasal type-1 receptor n=1 Tax=Castor canadensis TaxID=51338 RepID=A0A8C0WAK7_CASCN
MASGNLEMGFIFLTQTIVGILGNSFLLCLYNFTLFTGHKLRPTDLILNQLALANSLVLFFKGIPQTMSAFRMKYFLGDIGCKLVFYNYRLGTGTVLTWLQTHGCCPAPEIPASAEDWVTTLVQAKSAHSVLHFISPLEKKKNDFQPVLKVTLSSTFQYHVLYF